MHFVIFRRPHKCLLEPTQHLHKRDLFTEFGKNKEIMENEHTKSSSTPVIWCVRALRVLMFPGFPVDCCAQLTRSHARSMGVVSILFPKLPTCVPTSFHLRLLCGQAAAYLEDLLRLWVPSMENEGLRTRKRQRFPGAPTCIAEVLYVATRFPHSGWSILTPLPFHSSGQNLHARNKYVFSELSAPTSNCCSSETPPSPLVFKSLVGKFATTTKMCTPCRTLSMRKMFSMIVQVFLACCHAGAQLYIPHLLEIVERRPVYVRLALWFLHHPAWMESHTGGSRLTPTVHPCPV